MVTFKELNKYFEEHQDLARCCIYYNNYIKLNRLDLEDNYEDKRLTKLIEEADDKNVMEVLDIFCNNLNDFVKWISKNHPDSRMTLFTAYSEPIKISEDTDFNKFPYYNNINYAIHDDINADKFYIMIDNICVYLLYRFEEEFYSTQVYVETDVPKQNNIPGVYIIGDYIENLNYNFYLVNQPIQDIAAIL